MMGPMVVHRSAGQICSIKCLAFSLPITGPLSQRNFSSSSPSVGKVSGGSHKASMRPQGVHEATLGLVLNRGGQILPADVSRKINGM